MYNKNKCFLLFAFLSIYAFFSFAFAADNAMVARIDKPVYLTGENITVSGTVYSGTSPANGTGVNISVFNSSSGDANVTFFDPENNYTDENGTFSIIINPGANPTGTYTAVVSSGDASATIPFRISSASDFMMALVNDSIVVSFSSGMAQEGIAGVDAKITGQKKYGNKTITAPFFFVLENSTDTDNYDTLYVDDDNTLWFNNSDNPTSKPISKFLKKGSKVNIDKKSFELWYIDPAGSKVIFVEWVGPVFTGSGDESANILTLALNASGSPLPSVNVSIDEFLEDGTDEGSFDGATDGDGVYVEPINISTTGGKHYLSANDMAFVSYFVKNFYLKGSIKNEDGKNAYLFSSGQSVVIEATITDSSGKAITSATVTATVTNPDGSASVITLSASSTSGIYSNTFAPSATGAYSVEFKATKASDTQKFFMPFEVRGYDLYVVPVAMERGPADGFAPSEDGFIFVSARDLSNGGFANLSQMTGNCANASVALSGIYDISKNNVAGSWNVMNLTVFFDNSVMPPFMYQEIKRYFGEQACVINFTAPAKTGLYDLAVDVVSQNLTGHVASVIGVQDIFVHAYPVSETGAWQNAISPGGTVYLAIDAYDAKTGNPILDSKILDASIVEVFADNQGIVTDFMLNESFMTLSNGMKVIKFVANDSVMGHHFVKLKVSANVTRSGEEKTVKAIGEGWFQEKQYSVWVYPSEGMASFGSDSEVTMVAEVRDASGSSGVGGVSVSLNSVRYSRTWEDIENVFDASGQVPSCTTAGSETNDTSQRGKCSFSFSAPNGVWDSGGYQVEVKAKTIDPVTGNEVSDYGYGWFEVRNFRFFAWTKNWEVSTQQDITFDVELSDFDGTPISADVSIVGLSYMGTWESWQPPVDIAVSTTPQSITGTGTITLDSSTVSKEGQYAVKLRAVAGASSETTEAWFYAKPFTIWVDDASQNWERRYGKQDTVNLTLKGFESMNWSTWPPTGEPHNLSSAWVQSVEKMGMWGTKYRTKDKMLSENNMATTCDGTDSQCYLSFNLTGFEQGEYSIVIAANDSTGASGESYYWMRVETLRISVPELMDWVKAQEKYTMTNMTRFKLSDSCGSDSDSPIEPNNITNCKFGSVRLLDRTQPEGDWQAIGYNNTHFLLDKNTSSVYVNASQADFGNINFTGLSALVAGDTFVDSAGNNWTIASIDSSSNTIEIESTGGIIAYNTWSWDDQENKYRDTYLFKLDSSLSKSGSFLRADNLQENDWMGIDLDNDGTMYWNESYFIVLADTQTAGVYDKVYISNSTDFAYSIEATSGAPINFSTSPGVRSIYLLNKKYNSGTSGGTNYYQLVFTTNNAGWPGRDMGVHKPGSMLKIPVVVTEPSNKSAGITNARVMIGSLVNFGYMGETSVPVSATPVNTSSSGFAMLNVNLSGVQNGDYFVKISVEYNGENVTTATMWDNPRISVRNFVVRGELGMKGSINDAFKWDIQENITDDLFEGRHMHLDCWWNGTDNCGDPNNTVLMSWEWPYQNEIFYNVSSGMVIIDEDMDFDFSNAQEYNPATQLVRVKKYNNNSEFMNASLFGNDFGMDKTTTISTPSGSGNVVDSFHNFTVSSNNGTTATITISRVEPWDQWTFVSGKDAVFGGTITDNWGWNTTFTVTNITLSQVTLRWNRMSMVLKSGLSIEGKNKIARVWDAGNNKTLVLYNSPSRKTSEDLQPGNEWKDAADTVLVLNSETGALMGEYAIGEPIAEIGGKLVLKSNKWDERIYLSDTMIGGRYAYPMPWTCDNNNDLYLANFTEQSTGMKLKNGMEDTNLSSQKYYMLFFDGDCNGAKKITNVLFDDDPVFDDRWSETGPYDGDHPEEGFPEWVGSQYNMSERWMMIGQQNWPFTVTSFNSTAGNADLFTFMDGIKKGNNLTLWVSANDFDGVPVNGNITVKDMKGMTFSCDAPPQEKSVNISGVQQMSSGVGYFNLDLGNVSMGDYAVKFEIVSSDGKKEILEKHIWVDDKESMEACMGGPGGGGGYYG